ncbi:phage tail tape measure protein [Tianweitania sediminis]
MGTASRMALAGAAGAIAPIAGAYGASSVVREAADFESALTNIQKKAGITAEETARLGEEIKTLATSGDLAVPLEEIAAAYERGAAAGIPLDQLRQFALLSAKAADAFEMSAEDVGNTAAGLNKALGVPMERMESIFDLINGLADSGIADESGIVDFLDSAGAMGKTFGLTVEQTAALGATLANLKVPANEAATAVNSMLTKLLAPNSLSKKGFLAFKRLVGDTEEFAEKVAEDADGALVDLIKSLRKLDSASRTGVIADLFGQEHVDVVSQLVEGSEELVRNMDYAANQQGWAGSLNNSYQLKLDDFWSQWTIARNTLRELMIDAGNMSMPYIKSGLEEARAIFDEIGKGLETLKVEVDAQSFQDAKKALGELKDLIGSILSMGNEGSAIESFFSRMAALTNTLTGSIKTIREFGQEIGVITEDTPNEGPLGSARDTIKDAAKVSPPVKAVDKVLDLATGQGWDTGEIDAMRQDLDRLQRDSVDDDYYRRRWGTDSREPQPQPAPSAGPQRRFSNRPAKPSASSGDNIPIPTPRPSMAPSAATDDELSRIDQQLGELVSKKTQLEQGFKLAPDPAAVETMRQIGDQMQQLIERRNEISAMTVSPQVDASSIRAAKNEASSLLATLRQIPEAARTASAAAARARVDYSGMHADLSRAG